MIQQLLALHFELICVQMELKEEGKITLKDILDLTTVLTYQSTIAMSKHFHDFETYLSQYYGVEGFPLNYIVRMSLASAH